MDKNYTAQAQELTTDALLTVLQEYREYEAEAVLAAIQELEHRGVEVPGKYHLLQELEQPQPVKETQAENAKSFLMLFVPQPYYTVTPILLNLNLLVFLGGLVLGLDFMNPDANRLVDIGANFGPYTLTGEWWRLFTSMFLHGGVVHLLFNMVALVQIGMQLEALIGRVQFAVAYLLCGLAGSITSLWWISPEISVSVGASGAIFGMFGLLLVVMLLERELAWKDKKAILTNMAVVIGINLAYGMRGGIDNAAHVGGLLSGMAYGAVLLLRSDRYITQNYNLKGTAVTVGLGLGALVVFFNLIPFTGMTRYTFALDEIGKKEELAMQAVYELDKAGDHPDTAKLLPMVEGGIELWEECEVLLENIDDAPKEEQARFTAMLDYVRLRKLSYQMLRDDLKAGRPLMHAKQRQMLYAINHYAQQLQEDDFSEAETQYTDAGEQGLDESMITGSDGAPLDSTDMASVTDPLYVLDGKVLGVASQGDDLPEMQQLSQDKIKSIVLLKATEAEETFGKKAAGGAIVITTKKE
ncbi:rhomboid family intramembrane serine protease [Pontibacter sp. MBLB2868]|uniref:rhomboid family intramembrane serine protease n=1 Tax=Pontibacter sp. MBLB2868 TaxID=3451555 RepID=UPI003F74D762